MSPLQHFTISRCSDSLQILPKFDVDRSISRECGHFSSIVPQSCSVLMVAASEAPPQAVPHCLLLPRHGQCTLLFVCLCTEPNYVKIKPHKTCYCPFNTLFIVLTCPQNIRQRNSFISKITL